MSISKLGHVELRVTNLDEAIDYYTNMLGLAVTDRGSDRAHLRAAPVHHELTLVQAAAAGVEHYGWRVDSDEEMERLGAALSDAGHDVEEHTGEAGQGRSLRFTDPGGITAELYVDMEPAEAPGTITGAAPERISHIVFAADDLDGYVSLYCDVLGFRLSDVINGPGMRIGAFLRCNQEHHTLAILKAPIPGALHHVAWKVSTFDRLKDTADLLHAQGHGTEFGPGRHGIGQNTYLYFRCPDGVRMEVTSEMTFIPDDDAAAIEWDDFDRAVSAWGASPPPSFQEAV